MASWEKIFFLDNDALLKLARYGLLNAIIEVFESKDFTIKVLATAKYVLLPARDRLKRCKDEESASRLETFLSITQPIDTEAINPDYLDALSVVENIDAGESLLLAAAASEDSSIVVTGDKRALQALCSNSSIIYIRDTLAGRIVSLEVLFSILIKQDFTSVQQKARENLMLILL